MRAPHALDDDRPSAFRAQCEHGMDFFRSGRGTPVLDGAMACEILNVLLCALDSSDQGIPLDVLPLSAA